MDKNANFVAYSPQKESSWTFYTRGKSRTISDTLVEIEAIVKTIFDINRGFFVPTKVEYSLITEPADVPANNLFSALGYEMKPLEHFSRELHSDSGISYREFKDDIDSIVTSDTVIRYIRRIEITGKTRFALEGKDVYIDRYSKGLYAGLRDNTVSDIQPWLDPWGIDIQQSSLKTENDNVLISDPAYYKITFWTYTDMWFEDTPIGQANRNRLRKVLKGVNDSFDVSGTLFMSDHFSEKVLKEVVFGSGPINV